MTTDKLIAQIEHEISLHGGNRHQYPLSMGQHKGRWNVILEVNSSKHTLDIDTQGDTLPNALNSALIALRRQFSPQRGVAR